MNYLQVDPTIFSGNWYLHFSTDTLLFILFINNFYEELGLQRWRPIFTHKDMSVCINISIRSWGIFSRTWSTSIQTRNTTTQDWSNEYYCIFED